MLYSGPKDLANKGLLARFLNSNCNSNSHTNHGVVTSSDETHHLYASDHFPIFRQNMALS